MYICTLMENIKPAQMIRFKSISGVNKRKIRYQKGINSIIIEAEEDIWIGPAAVGYRTSHSIRG